MDDNQFRILLEYLQYSWPGYRKVRKGVKKRIHRHMQQLGCRNVMDYLKILDLEPGAHHECELLMTVSISRFFRDRRLWEMLKNRWLPDMIANDPPGLKVWSAGCACGEEAYSFKIIWELLGQQFEHLPALDLLATDRHPNYLERARSGIYNRSCLKEAISFLKNRILVQGRGGAEFSRGAGFPVRSNSFCESQTGGILEYFEELKRGTNKDIGPKDIFEIASDPDWREIYFESRKGSWQYAIKDHLKSRIRWEIHHLPTDSPGRGFDIIFLRNNVLTYYRQEAQKKTLTGILNSLSPGGLLIIGCHEALPFQPQSLRPMADLSYVFQNCLP
jgi:chemotaxis methyl-accepting protein methylase